MLEYFRFFYLEAGSGPGYIVTNIAYVVGLVLLLNPVTWTARGLARKAGEAFLWWLGTVVFCSVYYAFLGRDWMDRLMMVLSLVVYGVFFSKYRPITRATRSFVYFTCTMLALPISEPVGAFFEEINETWTWAEHLTWIIMVALMILVLALLRKFSTEELAFVPTFPVVYLAVFSAVSIAAEYGTRGMDTGVRVGSACCLWGLELLSYYMFYVVSREYDRNLELVSIRHKEELDVELLQMSRENYEEMHKIRHELKNHLAYLRVLAEHQDTERLMAYLEEFSGDAEELFQFVECGNDVVNAVVNHAIRQARARGVTVETRIVVPPTLPYRETELCSLLSNLMDNAIEGAAASGVKDPDVLLSIRPQQDYLFFRVTNPVDESVPALRRLSLRTTKEDQRLHGYGTKVIRTVAEHHQGSVKFDIRDGRFVADVMLYLGEEEEDHGEADRGDL